MGNKIDIIHFSDLHIGCGDFVEEYMENVIQYINDVKPTYAVCTGDITHKGREGMYQEAKTYLDKIQAPLMVIPGNHDHKNNGIVFFEEYFDYRRCCRHCGNDDEILLLGLRSGQDGTAEGELGDEILQWMAHEIQKHPAKFKIVGLHHHLINIPSAGIKRASLVDSGNALEAIRYFGVDLVLMGHRHVSHVWNLDGCTLLYCGTSASTKVRGRDVPSFNHIQLDLDNNELIAHIISSIDYKKTLLVHKKDKVVLDYEKSDTNLDHLLKHNIFDEV